MANFLRYNPADDAIDDLVRGFFMRPVRFETAQQAVQIKIDVSEDEKAYVVHAEIPGVKKEDIQVSIEGNQVAISAEIKREKDVKEGDKLLRSERYYGQLSRVFALSQDVDDAAAEAAYKDGILTLQLPKRASTSNRKLAIK